MTKTVRVENGDSSPQKLIAELWEKSGPDANEVLISSEHLDNPAQLTEMLLTNTRWVKVYEKPDVPDAPVSGDAENTGSAPA